MNDGTMLNNFVIQKGLKSNVVLTDLHLTGLFKVATFTAIDLDIKFSSICKPEWGWYGQTKYYLKNTSTLLLALQ